MARSRQFSVAYRIKDYHGQNHQLQAVKRHFPPVWLGSLQLFWEWPFLQGVCHVWALWFGWQKGLVNIPFNQYSKLDAAGKLTTHGSQHFHKQNALKAVAFLSTAVSPQLCVDTHISQNMAKQKEGNRKLVNILLTQVLVCARYRSCFISCVTFLNFESKYLKGQCHRIFYPFFSSSIHPIWGPDEQAKIFLIFDLGNGISLWMWLYIKKSIWPVHQGPRWHWLKEEG